MDKWKDIELEKMKVGGNRQAKEFFQSQSDYRENMTIQEKYNTRAAALLKDKIVTEASGQSWSIEKSSARNYQPNRVSSNSDFNLSNSGSNKGSSSNFADFDNNGYQSGEFKAQTENFFARVQAENANRPE
jgi:ADP-ribosylation factor GTPase-activating protein 1